MKSIFFTPPRRYFRRLGIILFLLLMTTGIKADNIPNQEPVTLASSVSYKNKKSDSGLYSLPSNVHPTSGEITHNNYYDVNGDGIMEVIGTSSNNGNYLHLVSTPTGNVLQSVSNNDYREFNKFI